MNSKEAFKELKLNINVAWFKKQTGCLLVAISILKTLKNIGTYFIKEEWLEHDS